MLQNTSSAQRYCLYNMWLKLFRFNKRLGQLIKLPQWRSKERRRREGGVFSYSESLTNLSPYNWLLLYMECFCHANRRLGTWQQDGSCLSYVDLMQWTWKYVNPAAQTEMMMKKGCRRLGEGRQCHDSQRQGWPPEQRDTTKPCSD